MEALVTVGLDENIGRFHQEDLGVLVHVGNNGEGRPEFEARQNLYIWLIKMDHVKTGVKFLWATSQL